MSMRKVAISFSVVGLVLHRYSNNVQHLL